MRTEWKAQIAAGEIRQAADAAVAYHTGRIDWWANEAELAQQTLRERGIDIRAHQVTGGQRIQAVLDPELADRLNECQGKIERHKGRVRDYTAWRDFLAAMPDDQLLEVNQSDFDFFHLPLPAKDMAWEAE